jgi:hypothetical protein
VTLLQPLQLVEVSLRNLDVLTTILLSDYLTVMKVLNSRTQFLVNSSRINIIGIAKDVSVNLKTLMKHTLHKTPHYILKMLNTLRKYYPKERPRAILVKIVGNLVLCHLIAVVMSLTLNFVAQTQTSVWIP